MAGVPPPPNLPVPAPGSTPGVGIGASMAAAPTKLEICGLSLLFPGYALSFFIPFPNFKLPLPFAFTFALTCDLDHPLDAEVTFGGGRQPTGQQPDPFSQDE